MRNFVKKALEKLEKLDLYQIKKLLLNIFSENEMLEMVLHSMTDGVIVISKNHEILLLNKSAKRLIPFVHGDVQEKRIWEAINDTQIAAVFQKILKNHEKMVDQQFALKNGTTRFISCNIMPLVNKGKIQGNLIRIEDITEKKNKEARLRRAESLASLSTLTAAVAHEIKNPLGSIGIHIQLIKKYIEKECEKDKTEITKFLNIINEEVERLNKVIVDFLFAVHPININFEIRNINPIIHDLLEFLKYELTQAHIGVIQNLSSIPDIEIDEKYIKQALLNIIKNAMIAMPNGGRLSVESLVKDDDVLIKISDTGIGIPEKIINKIFEPYFTTKDFGSGLGLTIVYKIIKEHQGDINVISTENEGTTFILSFPIPQKEKHLLDYKGDIE